MAVPVVTTAERPGAGLTPAAAVGVALSVVVLWALWAAAFNTAQFGDNVEQFAWAQSLELGYHKHPPLPSWLLGGVIRLWGPSVYWAYVLATLCLVATAVLTWSIARQLVEARVAAAAVLLWGLNMTFSQRVQLYNHNTLLVLCTAATVWAAMRASRTIGARAIVWWLSTGLAAGAAVLSKYQALAPLAALLAALLLSGRLRQRQAKVGLLLAVIVMVLVCTPHALWVARHDFTTVRYAAEAIETAGALQRLGFIVSFLANQLRLWSPALAAIVLCWIWGRLAPSAVPPSASVPADRVQPAPDLFIWFGGLVGGGVLILAAMALVVGVSLRNHWGVQALQFSSIWLAWYWERRWTIDLRRLAIVAVALHLASLAWYAAEHADPTTVLTSRRIDTMYPARRLARAGIAHWTAHTACPLRYVAGTVFDAGLVSLYSDGKLQVFDTEAATPWIGPEQLRRSGALYVLEGNDPAPPGIVEIVEFDVVPGDRQGRPARRVRLGLLLPEQPCSPAVY